VAERRKAVFVLCCCRLGVPRYFQISPRVYRGTGCDGRIVLHTTQCFVIVCVYCTTTKVQAIHTAAGNMYLAIRSALLSSVEEQLWGMVIFLLPTLACFGISNQQSTIE